MKRNPISWRQVFQQSPEALARLDEKRAEVLQRMERENIVHIDDRNGSWETTVAAAPTPRALKPRRAGIINIRRAR